MEEKVKENKQDPKIEKKKVYTPPALILYGKLTELTAAGTQNAKESSAHQGPGYRA